MPKAKDPRADKAFDLYKQGLKLIEIADQLGLPEGTVRSWKNRYKWKATSQTDECNVAQTDECNVAKTEKKKKQKKKSAVVEQVVSNEALSDREQLFCVIYVRCFNATRAYMKAFNHKNKNSASVLGCRMLKRPEVAAEIRRLKEDRMNQAFFSEEDVFQKYMEIAFADITDFVDFSHGGFSFKDQDEIDGTIVSEISDGKVTKIKLEDRMKALQWLSDHMDLATAEQKARIAVLKAQIDTGDEQEVDPAIDRFLQAIRPNPDELTQLFEEESGNGKEETKDSPI